LASALAVSPARTARSAPERGAGPEPGAGDPARAAAHVELSGVGRAELVIGGLTDPARVESLRFVGAPVGAARGFSIEVSIHRERLDPPRLPR
jgi:hypothetical protein